MDYEAIDLTPVVNADDDLETPGVPVWRGACTLRGLPFAFAERDGERRLLRVAPGDSVTVPVGSRSARVRTVTFAHRTRDDVAASFAPVGRENAAYTFVFSDDATVSVPVREGYEVAVCPAEWGHRPSLAVPDQSDSLPDREQGAFEHAGFRQTEVVEAGRWDVWAGAGEWRYYLWSWVNPRPEHDLVRIEIKAREAAVEIGGLCLGFIDEYPLQPEPARAVVAGAPVDYAGDGADLALEVDRGTVGYTTPLVRQPDTDDPFAAWGDAPDAGLAGVYARVSSTGSGTVRLLAGGQPVAQARWPDLRANKVAGLRVSELGRNWVRTAIVDDATGEPVPCRVHFSSPEGVPYQPYGHHQHVNSDLGSWHVDVGADVRLGRTTYAYVDGGCEGWLPRGQVRARVTRGFDYQPLDAIVPVGDDTRELTLRVKRLFDPAKEGWYSGDTHVHFVSSFGGLKEAAAEGVSVVHLLQSQWGSLFTNIEDFLGRPITSDDGKTVLFTSQENRQHFLGHLSLLGLKQPVMPWCTAGPSEAEMGAGLEATLSDWADRCHAQGGTVVIPHLPEPDGEPATLIATGRADAIESLGVGQDLMYLHYYRYLNAGFRLPIAGGTDKMSNGVPIGLSRTYARLGPDDDFGYDAWCAALRAGRSYMSSGPLLSVSADGAGIGDTVQLPDTGGTVAVVATAVSIFPMFRLELVHSGRVIASSDSESGAHELRINQDVTIDKPGWICARVDGGGPGHLTQHRDEWQRAIMAHTSPVYIACGAHKHPADREALEHIRTLIDRARSYVEHRAAILAGTDVLHHHGGNHRAYLIRPFDQARTAIEHRLLDADDQG
ncbi:MAG TPA: CehA/McbA family metallohydrolase [Streptosporangiaceae bacterium]